ncbi:1,4-dihydroxy-2-naphthoate octaprenyltransferase [Butyricimonas virosa]|jgi:1,4-dihydroxy-2-naphthoate octaprenyltransferase|uniref:1,4-dihydroxy-2-naphthoate octaprenyltransferase n=1 Tax=Butyricimonas virosa TaxID=544645 RepID=A0A413IUA8_9BACT|nr:1,4-dihydroxy-2-naphthoate octaprenyltransferase [Butyricimonas virosa]MCI7295169.1 1,4-dihydroxy-2-naphthoate octaprenyltransferase [Butyricimonas virosa]MDY5532751.1 1,4-dihydroxy-2-naphthoate octaprenyltransferase [Butyricimonas virosa]MDY6217755.1 1,4-dihydroxy-2-naphthoate octaprenyltransferase [Butyricimonas virosa]QRO49296.1 1,4-dihydroxy-2-naphthoate octaprenyltransferase [Butyricimonas virosa]RGL89101.1 1,4-dihydroxy-2-naphthoate octaprenyltransferase [Butyricimonas virosa]
MSKVRAYITSFRLRTLPLSLSGVLLGSLLAASDGYFKTTTFVWAMLTTVALQILSNLANEVGDLTKGTDNEHRLGPIRSAQSGALSMREMVQAMIVFGVIAIITGSLLIYEAFRDLLNWKSIALFIAGGASIVAAVKYTVGKSAYGYRGLGDLFVFIFFGVVSVMGSYFAMSGVLPWICVLPAAAIGFLSSGVLNMNNIRDIENDSVCGKRTIPVILGIQGAKIYHFVITLLAVICLVLYSMLHSAGWTGYLFLLTLPLLVMHLKSVYRGEGRALDSQLKFLSITTLLIALLLGFGQLLSC